MGKQTRKLLYKLNKLGVENGLLNQKTYQNRQPALLEALNAVLFKNFDNDMGHVGLEKGISLA